MKKLDPKTAKSTPNAPCVDRTDERSEDIEINVLNDEALDEATAGNRLGGDGVKCCSGCHSDNCIISWGGAN